MIDDPFSDLLKTNKRKENISKLNDDLAYETLSVVEEIPDVYKRQVLTMTEEWKKAGFVDDGFVSYVSDEKVVAFPWTMIDKITPRPSEQIAADLEKLGVESMQPVITSKKTYIAPFVNAEKPQYLVIEDSFPNGRPALEKGFGVYLSLIHIL